MKKKNGFTLIELLAVIIILGILMIIAIPSVTKYISDSRKNSYVDTAKEVIGSARNLVNSGELEMYDTDATYYIDVNCIKTENAMKSPYGDFTNAYVVVIYDGKGYDYFWTSVDDAGQGVKNIVKYDKLDTDDISSDLTIEDISTLRTLDGRGKVILITERNSCKKEGAITENLIPVNSEAGEEGGSSGGNTPTPTAASTILSTAQTAGQVNRIGTTDNYIFKGADPENYVSFNGETWRIIGIYGNQIKIQRTTALSSQTYHGSTPNPGWSNSRLYQYLNQETEGGYYYSLLESAKNLIATGTWNAGAATHTANAVNAYNSATATTVSAKVGLMATYEFLYASDGENCETTAGNSGSFNTMCGTADHDWMKTDSSSWTLSPRSDNANGALFVNSSGGRVDGYYVTNTLAALPAVFLKPSVKVASGDGTSGNPYILNLE